MGFCLRRGWRLVQKPIACPGSLPVNFIEVAMFSHQENTTREKKAPKEALNKAVVGLKGLS